MHQAEFRKNPFDKDEKTSQLKMMREIYEHASRVAVFLGPVSGCSQSAFKICDSIVQLEGKIRVGHFIEEDIDLADIYQDVSSELYQGGQSLGRYFVKAFPSARSSQ